MSFLQIRSISLTGKTHLRDLFDKTNFIDVKVQLSLLILESSRSQQETNDPAPRILSAYSCTQEQSLSVF